MMIAAVMREVNKVITRLKAMLDQARLPRRHDHRHLLRCRTCVDRTLDFNLRY